MNQTHIVPEGLRPLRADKALANAFPEHSRTALQRAFDSGLVTLRGVAIKRDQTVMSGDELGFALPETKPTELKAADIPLDVIYEDKHLLALNKAAGMIVHPGAATGDDTLVHALLAHCAGSLSGIGGVERPGIVHRLDKETTGVIVVAKNDAAHRALSDQFASRTLRKEYLALAAGVPDLLSGIIDRAISRHPIHRHRMTVGEGGKPSRTDWERIDAWGDIASLFRCRIHTGRTHQIRVHLKSLGHVIFGDYTYGWKDNPQLKVQPARVMLHAEHLVITHPVSGKELDLRAPLPADFREQLAQLGQLVGRQPEPKVVKRVVKRRKTLGPLGDR